jgi:hypothetical protein
VYVSTCLCLTLLAKAAIILCSSFDIPKVNNNLQGQIPSELGKLWTLSSIDLGMNAISGNFPEELCALPIVVLLAVHHNAMSGSIPACIGSLAYADVLAFSNNLFTGTLPTTLGTLTTLEELYIDDNLLDGDPTSVFNGLTGAIKLIANNNNFGAMIDSSFLPAHNNLTLLDLSQNNFTSVTFPEHLLRKKWLKVCDLSKNRLAGSIPQSIALNTGLWFLGLYENSLSGSLNAISNLTALIHLGT